MRRFRDRRGRDAALVLLTLAAMTTTSASSAGSGGSAGDPARISAPASSVAIGSRRTLRGIFPGAHRAPIAILYRARGKTNWRVVARDRTGASGRFAIHVRPPRDGYWRAELVRATGPSDPTALPIPTDPAATAATSIDGGTEAERIRVRSRITTRVPRRHLLAGRPIEVHGRVLPAGARRRVVVTTGGHREPTWTARDGRFSVSWPARSTGVFRIRARARSNRTAAGGRDSAGRVTVYRPAAASWYGPGLYGNPLACGGVLTPSTIGVAHKSMPCGTKLRLRYRSRTVAVRVIDRGPYVAGREFDLTGATRQALGFGSTGTVLSSR